jgi:decaprenyl-phosphate phosphoribosyltransferase
MRPGDWVKNLFILVPLFFSGKIHFVDIHPQVLTAFVGFCLASSFVYIINDIVDIEKDKNHPVKRNRPIPSGIISKREAIAVALTLLIANSTLLYFFTEKEKYYILIYIVLNITYSFFLKNVSIIDLTIISIGFVIRVLVGGIAADVSVSKWLILMVFLLAMCLGLGKRRDELFVSNQGEINIRPALKGYNPEFINTALAFMTVTTVICYIMYSLSPDVVEHMGTENIYYTSFFVILGLLRFLQIVIVEQKSGSPTRILLNDRFTQVILVLWGITFTVLIYLC